MVAIDNILSSPATQRIGWALVHSLWRVAGGMAAAFCSHVPVMRR